MIANNHSQTLQADLRKFPFYDTLRFKSPAQLRIWRVKRGSKKSMWLRPFNTERWIELQ